MIHARSLLLLLLLGCASCATQPVATTLAVAPIPEPLLTCQDAPDVPDPGTATQRDVAAFMVHLWGSWEDCTGNLAAISEIVHKQQTEVH